MGSPHAFSIYMYPVLTQYPLLIQLDPEITKKCEGVISYRNDAREGASMRVESFLAS